MRVRFRPAAQEDLDEIWAGAGCDSVAAARRLHARLISACGRLADFPRLGRASPRGDLREAVSVRPYVIIYRVLPDVVTVVRIVHGARLR